ncbi:MAG: VOC family protein [Ginsengibacter sp.]
MDKKSSIPDGYQTVMPYLILKNAQEFIEFTENVFNAVEIKRNRQMRDEKTIMHSEIQIGGNTIMFADSTEQFAPQPGGLFIYVDDADETFKKAIANGASVINEVADQSYGRSGGVEDSNGNSWWITSVK